MRITVFHGRFMAAEEYSSHDLVTLVSVPTLSAYAVEHAEFVPPMGVDTGFGVLTLGTDFYIEDEHIRFWSGFSLKFSDIESCRLVLHYHGVRDYSLLFPMITEPELKSRLGQFYEEAENAFDRGSWLAFALMAAAVYEGLLGWKLRSQTEPFAKLIASAAERGIIEPYEAQILNTAREHRNLVHASKFATPWVKRSDAMDMRTMIDGLIRKLAQD